MPCSCVARSRWLDEAAQLVLHHLETRAFGAGGRGGLAQRLVEAFPLLLPARHRGFGFGEARRPRPARLRARLVEARAHFGERRFELGGELAVADPVQVGVLDALRDLLEFLPLARANFARVVDGLLGARDFGADLVVAALHFGEHRRLRVVLLSRTLDRGLDRALLRDRRLQREVALVQDCLARGRFALHFAQLEREQLRVRLPLLLLERLVAARRGGLALQVAQLLLDLVAQVAEAREVLARLRDAALGLLALLLVARDAGGFLEERAHVLGLRLDHARDHVLLDDRVAARAEARAEEQLRDVLAAAAHAVQEIRRLAVARHDALERHLGVVRVLAAELAVAVVEDEFDRRGADGLRVPEPLKMTSAIESPRRCLAEISPMTQRTASMMFDLPQPFGPTTPTRFVGKPTEVGSTNDLKPASLILVRRINSPRGTEAGAEREF